jgi:hypothetical protein
MVAAGSVVLGVRFLWCPTDFHHVGNIPMMIETQGLWTVASYCTNESYDNCLDRMLGDLLLYVSCHHDSSLAVLT